jgi:Ser/Thr protein kinase RdoA (MazF antagonist)
MREPIDAAERASILSVLAEFGIARGAVTGLALLTGGLLSRVLRVDAGGAAYALKRYSQADTEHVNLQTVCEGQVLARACGIPVPEIVRSATGALFGEAAGAYFVLSRFVEGRAYEPDLMPVHAARRLGETLAQLQTALASLPAGEAPALWSHGRIEAYLDGLLRAADSRRHADAVDTRAYEKLLRKRRLLDKLGEAPAYEPGWTHGDYHWRNVLFGVDGEVAAVIDFDTLHYFSPVRDVMRCLALSFPNLGEAAFEFLAGYVSGRRITPEQAVAHVELYRYLSSYRVWPESVRYLEPETYDPAWDGLIQPFPDWDWDVLADRFATIASDAR